MLTLEGFCKLRRELDAQPSGFLDSHSSLPVFAEIAFERGRISVLVLRRLMHRTSPIRKYGDMINHRLLKTSGHQGKLLRVRRKISPSKWRNAVA
ncbi:hypothetical protein KCP73_26505 [Salmonella enterica subsp. enterica]|nr:hypothetical protein KCP73_26505 [Salmonella enterica subsp. enterica]